jgi:hypothetical protein
MNAATLNLLTNFNSVLGNKISLSDRKKSVNFYTRLKDKEKCHHNKEIQGVLAKMV